MKKLFILAAAAGAGFVLWKTVFASSSAYAAYERFADAMLYDRWEEARELASGSQAREAIDDAEQIPKQVGQERYRLAHGVVHGGPSRKLESEEASADGKRVTLKVIQQIRRGPTTMAPIGKPTVRQTQTVVLVETDGGWQVEEFKEVSEPLDGR
jgi:hypothetical protein